MPFLQLQVCDHLANPFVISSLDNIYALNVAVRVFLIFELVSVAEHAGLRLTRSPTLKTGFTCGDACADPENYVSGVPGGVF